MLRNISTVFNINGSNDFLKYPVVLSAVDLLINHLLRGTSVGGAKGETRTLTPCGTGT